MIPLYSFMLTVTNVTTVKISKLCRWFCTQNSKARPGFRANRGMVADRVQAGRRQGSRLNDS